MSGDLRKRTSHRQRELAARHDVLVRENAGSARYDDLLRRVFDATGDLIVVLDEAAGRAVRRRRITAGALLVLALVVIGLAAARTVPALALPAAVVVAGAAAIVWPYRHRTGRKDDSDEQ
ncbi:hypothetical protein [Actinoplanes sp. N902-109]|uniref:hypothetical protein n=1 Tax=Actinoplanes sp. (strain N902-109) TaxID=649831 RepID=UPI0003294409|nr:hypothetical protein [Actinoplanes sp. N902-109]AGL19538.1 hypothetical protein L083_6028 [Actinoplanes sp. N902-109]